MDSSKVESIVISLTSPAGPTIDVYRCIEALTVEFEKTTVDCTDRILHRTVDAVSAFKEQGTAAASKCIDQAWREAHERGPGYSLTIEFESGGSCSGTITHREFVITLTTRPNAVPELAPIRQIVRAFVNDGLKLTINKQGQSTWQRKIEEFLVTTG